ncbi:hypothetical protein [Methanolobus sp. WCC4]|uniref:hypothetical protein n=1 Tax=Methanolobus sp. WCC4 TaxID=3125784 RepID=UPI0030F63FBA
MKRIDESGQIILISGFIIAIGIVVLTVMLNNIVYASNTASESSIETNVFDYSNVVDSTIEAHEKAYADSNYGANTTAFNAYMANYSEKMIKSYSLSGFICTLDTGTLQNPYFTENGLVDGNDNWIVVERINHTDRFNLFELNASTLGNESSKLTIEANNQSGSRIWLASIFNSSGNVNVTVYDNNNLPHYWNNSDTIYNLNITGNEINGNNSFEFYFNNQTANQIYSLTFMNGSDSMGTFRMEGGLRNGDSYYAERIHVVESTMKLNKNGHLEVNATIPITLPKGHI